MERDFTIAEDQHHLDSERYAADRRVKSGGDAAAQPGSDQNGALSDGHGQTPWHLRLS